MPPPIRYVKNGEVSIAYQVSGDGPHDVLVIPGWVSHLALDWEERTGCADTTGWDASLD